MNFNRVIIILLILAGNYLNAQVQEDLLLVAEHSGGEMTLKWYPLQPEVWDELNSTGYNLERSQLDDAGKVIPGTQTILTSNQVPRDSAWFAAQEDGYINTIGLLLYEPDFKLESEVMDSKKVRYSYLVYEAQMTDNAAAKVLGLYFNDASMVDGLKYRYRVFADAAGKLVSAQVDMDAESGLWRSTPEEDETLFDFEFPGGQTLTQMSGRLVEQPLDALILTTKTYGDSIVLRWGPSHSNLWENANKEGYVLMRTKTNEPDAGIDSFFIKPWPLEDLDASIAYDSMALIASQVLYGNTTTQPANIYEQASLSDNRFGMALFAAERSALAAEILGLRFVDKEVKPSETYTYYITTPASGFPMHGDFKNVENVRQPELSPVGLKAEAGDHAIELIWSKNENDRLFSAYLIERSEDEGQTWQLLTKRPLVIMDNEKAPVSEYSYLDSVGTNDKTYRYRLKGMNAFAEVSPATEVSAKAVDLSPPPAARITFDTVLYLEKRINFGWKDEEPVPDDFAGYQILMGTSSEGLYDTISALLPPISKTFAYRGESFDGKTPHYFKVLSLDKAGNASESLPKYMHVPDLVAPEPPTNLDGTISDDNIVTLVWDHSLSEDAAGYWVYYTYDTAVSFTPLDTLELITSNFYRDTLTDNLALNEKIYYAVAAEDDNDNLGRFSEIIEIQRPDKVPPLRPLMNAIANSEQGLLVSWQPSASEDVWWYEVVRRNYGSETWTPLDTIMVESALKCTDSTAVLGQIYEYSVRAMDDAELYSDYAFPRQGKWTTIPAQLAVTNFKISMEDKAVRLSWQFSPPSVLPSGATSFQFQIFKSYGGENVAKIASISSNTLSFIDEKLEPGALHNYAVMVVFDSGHAGPLSDVISVKID